MPIPQCIAMQTLWIKNFGGMAAISWKEVSVLQALQGLAADSCRDQLIQARKWLLRNSSGYRKYSQAHEQWLQGAASIGYYRLHYLYTIWSVQYFQHCIGAAIYARVKFGTKTGQFHSGVSEKLRVNRCLPRLFSQKS